MEEPIGYEEAGELMCSGMKIPNPSGLYDLSRGLKTSSLMNGGRRKAYAMPMFMIKEIEAELTRRQPRPCLNKDKTVETKVGTFKFERGRFRLVKK